MGNSKVNGRICFLFLGVRCCMPSKSNTVVPKSQVSFPLSALHKRFVQIYAIVYFHQISEISET